MGWGVTTPGRLPKNVQRGSQPSPGLLDAAATCPACSPASCLLTANASAGMARTLSWPVAIKTPMPTHPCHAQAACLDDNGRRICCLNLSTAATDRGRLLDFALSILTLAPTTPPKQSARSPALRTDP